LGSQKDLGILSPNAPPCVRAWEQPSPERLPLGAMFVQGS